MMRSPWVSIIGAGLCIGLVPACTPLLAPPPGDRPPSPAAKQEGPVSSAPTGSPDPAGTRAAADKPFVNKGSLAEPLHYPAAGSGSELIPEPRNPAEMPPAAEVASTRVQDPPAESHPNGTAKPVEDPPLIEAIRCFLDKRPGEAVAWLDRFDKPSQEILLGLLPLAVRLTEQDRRRQDPEAASALLNQMDRLAYHLRRRAPLRISKMCFCESIQGYGQYQPRPEDYSFRPGELARLYIELQNLSDDKQDNDYRFHLLTTIKFCDFYGNEGSQYKFHDSGPDISRSERHDFYYPCAFHIPARPPGFYTLYVKITDMATGREVEQTLDFRIGSRRIGG